ncbi:DUF222 domain-containing protein [uncultured Amnibacterium sp.]|uniref:HNH endonuclease signature motif containing protein n=1 Tax=uncultured Amnibacterium sp. TaxID=1631851 RepID=UPI0035CC7772
MARPRSRDWNAFVASEAPAAELVPTVDLAELGVELRLEDRRASVDAVRSLAESGLLATLPGASGYRSWTDAELARLRQDPEDELDDDADADVDAVYERARMADLADDAHDPLLVHPLNWECERVDAAQREFREAEVMRVLSALNAWRSAEASVTGTVDAAVNGPFWKSVILQLATSLQVAEPTASALVHTALDLEQRMPRTWLRFLHADVPWRGMQIAHAQLEGLDEAFLGAFDEGCAAALVTVAMPKMRQRLHEIRERIQASTAAERHRAALEKMSVTIEPAADGMAVITALVPAAEAISIDLRLDLAARESASAEGETRSIGRLRAHILLDLFDEGLFRGATSDLQGIAVPQRIGVQCKVGLMVPAMTALGHSDVPAELEGYGPIDIETAKRLAGGATSWITLLTDEVTGAVLDIGRDKYRPTSDMRAMLGFVDRGGRGPNSYRPPSQTEADHVIPFNQGLLRGRTALDNLVLLTRRDHRIKTSGLWDIELRAQRDLAWTSFFGTRIITTVRPLEPTPVPAAFRAPADPDPDPSDCPF